MGEPRIALKAREVNSKTVPKRLTRAGLYIINNYPRSSEDLGDAPMNDGYHIAKLIGEYGFKNYYMHNPKKKEFVDVCKHFLKKTSEKLVIFYAGHGANIRDIGEEENGGYDDVMIFQDGTLVDDKLLKILGAKHNDSVLILITDACQFGSMWNIQGGNANGRVLPRNVLSISSLSEEQTEKQSVIDQDDQGTFSFHFRKQMRRNPKATIMDIRKRLKRVLLGYGQTCVVATTTRDLLNKPLFE